MAPAARTQSKPQPGDRGTAAENQTAAEAERKSADARQSRGQHGETVIVDDDDVTGSEEETEESSAGTNDGDGDGDESGDDDGDKVTGPGAKAESAPAPSARKRSRSKADDSAGDEGGGATDVDAFLAGLQELAPEQKKSFVNRLAEALGVGSVGPKKKKGPTLADKVRVLPVNIEETEKFRQSDERVIVGLAKKLGIDRDDILDAAVRQARDGLTQRHIGPKYLRVVTSQGRKLVVQIPED